MKKIIACIAFLIAANSIYSQQTNSTVTLTKQDYLKKSKNQKTAAWIFMGGGIVVTGLGLKDTDSKLGNSEGSRSTTAIVVGITAIGIGTTLFIASTRNKKKSEMIGFRMEKVPLIDQRSFVYSSYPALSFRLKF